MNISLSTQRHQRSAFSLVEVLVGMSVAGIMLVSLYAGFSSGFTVTQVARENLRATQIMVEKMETIRLYNWDQVSSNGFIPSTFTEYYYPSAAGGSNSGVQYSGRVTLGSYPFSVSYSNDMKQITIDLSWTSGRVPRSRQMTSFIARQGLQNYVY